jgi:hypothetical protein
LDGGIGELFLTETAGRRELDVNQWTIYRTRLSVDMWLKITIGCQLVVEIGCGQ